MTSLDDLTASMAERQGRDRTSPEEVSGDAEESLPEHHGTPFSPHSSSAPAPREIECHMMMVDPALLPDLIAEAIKKALAPKAEVGRFMTSAQAAEKLGLCDKTFRSLVRARKIRFALVGRRKKFTEQDLEDYRATAREAAESCRLTSRRAPRSTISSSSSRVFDITARLEQREKQRLKK